MGADVPVEAANERASQYVGTIVGESTSREFRLAVAHEAVREQDIIAVDADLRATETGNAPESLRVWAKVQRIERLNPLFPSEAGHELAATHTDPFDTVLSLSREMVSAVCQVLGTEPRAGDAEGRLGHLRYPAQPASRAYRPDSDDVKRVVLGSLRDRDDRTLDVARLANRPEVDVKVDGDAVVRRHLAILAMTGAGKSWAARRIIEQIAERNYPVVIFDPHGDYTGLATLPGLRDRVKLFYADLPVLDEDVDTASQIVGGLSGEDMSPAQYDAFNTLFAAVRTLLTDEHLTLTAPPAPGAPPLGALHHALYAVTKNDRVTKYGFGRDLFALEHLADAVSAIARRKERKVKDPEPSAEEQQLVDMGFKALEKIDAQQAGTYRALARQLRRAAFALQGMQQINRSHAGHAAPLPATRTELVTFGQISVVSLAGYTEQFQATIYALIARELFKARVRRKLQYPYVMVLEEGHNFVPSKADHPAILRAIETTKQIAQEGRKFGAGLVLISQRPSRLDETTLAMCNSYVIMRMVNPTDQSFVRKVIESLGEDEARMLPDLDVGEAILSGQFINFPVLVKMKEPDSRGEREEGKDAFQELGAVHRAASRAVRGGR